MATLNELLQDWVNKDYDELAFAAKRSLQDVMPLCLKVDPDNKGCAMATSIILTAIGADGTLTALEKRLLCDVLGCDEAFVQKMISLYDSRMVDLTDKFVDALDGENRAAVCVLVLAFIAVDEKISKEENALIHKLLS